MTETTGTEPPTRAALFVFDVDGTLLNSRLRVSPATRTAVHDLMSAGHKVALASARPPRSIAQLSEELLGTIAEMIALNGAFVAEGERVLIEQAIPATNVRAAVEYARAAGLEINVYTGWEWWVESPGPGIDAEADIVGFRPTVVESLGGAHAPAAHKILLIGDPERARQAREWARSSDMAVEASLSKPHYCELVASGVSKSGAMDFLASRLGIARQRVVAFGDGENDLPMIEAAGVGVAMGNAIDEVKRAATLTTTSHDDDGIPHALRTLGYLSEE